MMTLSDTELTVNRPTRKMWPERSAEVEPKWLPAQQVIPASVRKVYG